MNTISPELDRMLREIGGPESPAYQNLLGVIEASPVLAQQMNTAVAMGHLRHFAVMPADENAGASYSPDAQAINLKEADLLNPRKRHALTFILGHEIQHAINGEHTIQAARQFDKDVRRVLESGLPIHDYSRSVDQMLAVNRSDEASAHIAGWNALVSRLTQERPGAGLSEVAELARYVDYANDFIDVKNEDGQESAVAKPGFAINSDLSITVDSRNIEAAAKHYFDKAPLETRLGHHGNSDYTNYYAAGLVGTVCQYEMLNPRLAGQLQLDMDGLKLEERLLEQNGISLGSADARCAYYDTRSPMIENHFDHTADRHAHIPIHGLPRPSRLAHDLSQDAAAAELTDPDHPGHALFKQAQAGVYQLDADVGRTPDHRSDQLAAALAAAASAQGMDRIDHVALSTDASKVFAMQGALNSPFKQIASVPTVESLYTSVSQSTQAWERASVQSQEKTQEPLVRQTQQRQEPAMRL
ncbi:XVIPCD domain-containing protein [Variovorax sp. Sphag1AA]|uniref:XVIPCD domain-containing protein n=1 Tax=Variovorax sp. Sphag1AA TaxID=2587027 RepID=UPI0016070509|nr:XVIPCD domain-containing protein [Variovorax sp. Sphag1AA]MBB3180541.1 hypothetical protein [Variovorax sp. Sphag1AA]